MAFLDELLEKIRKPLQYFDPTSNQGQNFWSTKTAEKLAKVQSSPVSTFSREAVEATGVPKYLDMLHATGRTALGMAQMKNAPETATKNLEKALELRQKRGLEGSFDQGLKSGLKTVGSGAEATIRTALTLKGMPKVATPGGAIGTAAIGTLGGGLSKMFGGSFAEGAGRAVGYSPATRAFTSMTDPLIRRAIPAAAGPIAQRLASGVGNLAQDEALSAATGQPNTPQSRALSFIMGTAYGPGMFDTGVQVAGRKPGAMHEEDVAIVDRAFDILHSKKSSKEEIDLAADQLDLLADKYLTHSEIDKAIKVPKNVRDTHLGQLKGLAKALQKKAGTIIPTSNYDRVIFGFADNKPARNFTAQDTSRVRSAVTQAPPEPPSEPLPWESKTAESVSTPESLVQSEIDERIARAEIGQEYGPTGVKKLLNRILNPLKNAPEPVQQAANTWRKEVLTARTDANALARQFADIPAEDGWKMVRYIENPTTETAQRLGFNPAQYQKQTRQLRQVYDQAREEGLKKGLDIGYIDNYLNHVWQESWGEIATKVRGAGARPYFTKERVIPSLEEGLALGLTPRFTHPAQFVAHYKEALGKAMANKKLVDSLVKSGQLVPASDAPLDWQSINAPLFPKVTKIVDGKKQVISDYKAPPNVAEAINSIFEYGSGQHSGLEDLAAAGANVSKRLQEVSLTGGIGPANAFTYGQAIKEVTSGRVKSPVTSFVRAWSDKSSKQFFAEKQPVIRMMNEEGIPVYHTGDYQKMFDNLAQNKTLKQKLGGLWDKAFNEATFRRFMPMLEVNFFEDTYNNALKSGLSEVEARRLAGEATKHFYGIADNFARSKFVDDTISTAFFAPTFRESMVNFWINNAKALSPKNLGDKAYNANRKFLAGTVLTYLFYNAANKALTGHSMSENKGGKELSVEIPVGDNRSIFVPMLPSVGTLPRRAGEMAGALLEGDVRTATQKAGSLLSSPISLGSQLATNRTFYGGPIYKSDDPALAKIGKLGGYALEQASPSYIGEPIAYLQGRKTPVETALGIMEVPAYPSASTTEKPAPMVRIADNQVLAAGQPGTLAQPVGTKPSFLESLFSLRQKEEPLRELPKSSKELAVIFGEASKTLDSYEEKRVKAEYGQYESDKSRQDALAKLEEDRAYAQAVLERIKSERPEQLFEVGLETYASGAGSSVEKRAEWAAGELSNVATQEEFSKKLDQMLEANVVTKDVATALREEYGLPVYKYTSGGKIKTISGIGSSSLSKILGAAREDAEATRKLYEAMTATGRQPSALEAVLQLYGQNRATSAPTASSLEAILAQKRRMEPIAKLG